MEGFVNIKNSIFRQSGGCMSQDLRKQLLNIFNSLLEYFGPRHWWPAETPLEVIFGCILTQNVTWKNVEVAISNLKRKNLININKVLSIPSEDLAQLIKTTRYYNQKTSTLKNFCFMLKNKFDGDLDSLFRLDLENLRKILLSLKGIGKETADAIILYAANKPIFVIDAYTIRIFSRIGFFNQNTGYDEAQRFFHHNLPQDLYLYNEYHALIDALGQNICKAKNPNCYLCPINHECRTYNSTQN